MADKPPPAVVPLGGTSSFAKAVADRMADRSSSSHLSFMRNPG
jgi:hypothetical protein